MSCVRVVCLSRAASPITHMAGSAGNESLISREPVRLPDGSERRVPTLSGNALRHVCVRAPGMRWLVGEYGLAGSLSLAQLNFLFHGGSLTQSTGREDLARVAAMAQAWPILRLLGGCLPGQILQGALRVSSGVLCCEENRPRLAAMLGEEALADLPPLLPAEAFVKPYQYSTFDAIGREPDLASRKVIAAGGKGAGEADVKADPRMLYAGECVQAGALFAHDYLIQDPIDREVGCLLWSLDLWQRSGGVAGGMGAKGHGKLITSLLMEGAGVGLSRAEAEAEAALLVACYLRHARERRADAAEWLDGAFAKPQKPKPERKSRGTQATDQQRGSR